MSGTGPTLGGVSKTERALDSDGAALDELDDFVAAEAEAADLAIDHLIDDAVDHGNGNGSADELDVDELVASDGNGSGELAVDELDVDELVGADDSDGFEVVHLEELIETEDGIADEELAAAEAAATPSPDGDDSGEVAVLDVEADDVVEAEDVVEADEVVEADDETDDDDFELPEIVPATPDDDSDEDVDPSGPAPAVAREAPSEVSDDILEELRRADIDGPTVDFAPQDDTTSARRRPKRRPDYDPAPVPIPARPPRILGRKPRVRKVTRVVRQVDPWSVFKIAALAFMVLYAIMLTAGVLLWNVAYATGTIDNVERFFESFGWSTFEFNGGEIYHASWIIGLFAVIGLTGMAVLAATLFNLITDIVGGVRFTVLEEEVVETRTSPMRRFVVRRPEPEIPAVTADASGPLIREAVVDDSGAIER